MTQEGDIARLEETVTGLLKKFTALKAEKSSLEQRLADKISENEALQSRLDNMQSERIDVSDRVSSLLDQIEQWEESVEVTTAAEDTADPVVEEMMVETVEIEAEDEEKNYDDSAEARQGRLFSVDPSAANS